jgi:hypothetical protein
MGVERIIFLEYLILRVELISLLFLASYFHNSENPPQESFPYL